MSSTQGNSQSYLLRRLARDAPEVLDRVKLATAAKCYSPQPGGRRTRSLFRPAPIRFAHCWASSTPTQMQR
jgi:hypothetical protein